MSLVIIIRLRRRVFLILCIITTFLLYSNLDPKPESRPNVLSDHHPYLLDPEDDQVVQGVSTNIRLQPTLPTPGPPETTTMDSKCQKSRGCFPGFSHHVDFTKEIRDSVEGGPMDYLPKYKNPCWYSKVPNGTDNPYSSNPYHSNPEADLVDPWRALSKKRDRGEAIKTRCLPLVYLIGVTKSGTTDLFDSIVKHTGIAQPSMKEPMWWNRFTIGKYPTRATFSHYVDLFDGAAERIEIQADTNSLNHNVLTIDGTPAYLWDYDGWENIPGNKGLTEPRYVLAHALKKLVPNSKIIVILRNPTERLFSQFRMRRPTASVQHFHQRIVQALDTFRDCLINRTLRHCTYKGDYEYEKRELFVRASLYSVYLADWLKVFPKEQLLVIKAEEYYADRRTSVEQVFKFLELGLLDDNTWKIIMAAKVKNSKQFYDMRLKDDMLNSTREMLNTFFQPYNERLSNLLGDNRFLWQ